MEMKVIFEGLIPGMKHGDDSYRCAQTPLAKLQQRFTDGFKKKRLTESFCWRGSAG